MSRWIIAQESQGPVESAWWAVIDTQDRGVRAKVLGESLASGIAEGLNDAEATKPNPLLLITLEAIQGLIDDILGSVERDCGHAETGDGSLVTSCGICMTWAQAQQDAQAVSRHLTEAPDGG